MIVSIEPQVDIERAAQAPEVPKTLVFRPFRVADAGAGGLYSWVLFPARFDMLSAP